MPVYQSTLTVTGREISQTTDGAQTLADVAGKEVYLQIRQSNGVLVCIDIAQYLLREPRLDLSMTLADVVSGLSERQVAGYATDVLPMTDPITGRIVSRIEAYDALAAADVTVSWTSLWQPGVRNDIYQRANMKDLVISAPRRDFTHCLAAVNGVFHKTHLYNGELYIQDGYFNVKNVRHDRVAVYDTAGVGGHQTLPIQIANIDASNTHPFSGVTLTFPGEDFTDKTLLLVLGGYLHALDDTYRVLGRDRVVIDTCKIDLINQFLHNPNTILTKAGLQEEVFLNRLRDRRNAPLTVREKIEWYLWNLYPTAKAKSQDMYNLIAIDPPVDPPAISVLDKITYYLTNSYPWARANTVTPFNVMSYTPHPRDPDDAPTTTDDIYAFLAAYPTLIPPRNTMLADYEWTTKYERMVSIVGSVPMSKFTDDAFVYNMLLSPHTFFVVVNNPHLYKRHYPLSRALAPDQYTQRREDHDTPRGVMLYNAQQALPFVVYSNNQQRSHHFSLDYAKYYLDAYKTAINPPAVPSPLYDLKQDRPDLHVELLELFAPP